MQGIFVANENPKASASLPDLAQPGLRFVNCQQGSGTRVLRDFLLENLGLAGASIAGDDSAEFNHAAVAAHVASGMADAGFGVETAARRFNLKFIPVIGEQYFFACSVRSLATPMVAAAQSVMQSAGFKATLAALPGYDSAMCGAQVKMAF